MLVLRLDLVGFDAAHGLQYLAPEQAADPDRGRGELDGVLARWNDRANAKLADSETAASDHLDERATLQSYDPFRIRDANWARSRMRLEQRAVDLVEVDHGTRIRQPSGDAHRAAVDSKLHRLVGEAEREDDVLQRDGTCADEPASVVR